MSCTRGDGGSAGVRDRAQFVQDLRAVIKAGIDIIGDIPYKEYRFLAIGPSTTQPIDYDTYLAYAGLQLEPARTVAKADLGALAEDVNGALTVAAVERGSAAARAGIVAGDVIASVEGARVDAAALKAVVNAREPGDRVQMSIERGGARQNVEIALDAMKERTWRLTPLPNPTALQTAILAGLTDRVRKTGPVSTGPRAHRAGASPNGR